MHIVTIPWVEGCAHSYDTLGGGVGRGADEGEVQDEEDREGEKRAVPTARFWSSMYAFIWQSDRF